MKHPRCPHSFLWRWPCEQGWEPVAAHPCPYYVHDAATACQHRERAWCRAPDDVRRDVEEMAESMEEVT